MSEVLLATKLAIPQIRQNIVNRQILIDKLNDGLALPLTLISSPPGFGKTTLACAWAQQSEVPVGWLTLEKDDNDISRFIQYLYAAVRSLDANLPELQMDVLKSPNLATPTLVHLINELNHIPTRFALVLDDYQEISLPAIHDAVTYLLEHMPSQMHLIITSRADPPFPLSRLRARRHLNEIRATDLRFTRAEIDEFNTRIMGLNLRPEDAAALETRTEGWIAGLQLAALSMQGKHDLSAFVTSFTGSHEFIVDYLTDEVLNQQTVSVSKFLLKTSILNRMTGSLCDAVTGETGGQQMLEYLDKANLFVTALDNRRQWYRYHRLFSDLLHQRLQQAYPDEYNELHARASCWYELHNMYSEAIDHALDGELFDRAATLIDNEAESMLMHSEVTTILHYIERLPENYLDSRPSLGLFYAWAAVMEGYDLDRIEKRLKRIDGFDDGKADSFRAFASLFQGRISQSQQQARRALTHITDSDQFLMSATSWLLSVTDILNSDLHSSRQMLEDITKMSQAAGNAMMTIMTMCNVAEMTMRQGQLHTARALYEKVLSIPAIKDEQALPVSGMAYLGLAELYREWGDFTLAKSYVEKGMAPAVNFSIGSSVEAHLHLARIYQSEGDYKASQLEFDTAADFAAAYKTSDIDDRFVELLNARLWILQGKLNDVKKWAIQRQLFDADSAHITSYYDYHIFHHEFLTVVRLRLAQDQPSQALKILDELLRQMNKWGWIQSRREIEVHVLRAVALYELGNNEQALQALISGLELAEPGGYVRTFVEEGVPIAQLLELALSRGIMVTYTSQLLDAFSEEQHSALSQLQDLYDPLSERELEVLRLISAGLSNPAIAKHLVVAVGTVKAHTSSIYSKLNVANRVQAAERARELHLI